MSKKIFIKISKGVISFIGWITILYFSFIWLVSGSSLFSPSIYTQNNSISEDGRTCVLNKDGFEPIGIGRVYLNLVPITHRAIIDEEDEVVFVRNYFYTFPLNTVEIEC